MPNMVVEHGSGDASPRREHVTTGRGRGGPLDALLGLAGVAFGLVSLTYPFGRDQGLYYYVGREWALHGSIPYRDVLDHKTPGLYVLHALSVALFGEQLWGIRLFELLCVVALGLIAGSLTAPRGLAPRNGVRGAAILSASILFYGFLDFWNTAQSELWYSTLGLAGIWAALRVDRTSRAAIIAGLVGSTSMIMKPPSVWFVMIACACLAWRGFEDERADAEGRSTLALAVRGVIRAALPFAAGFAVPLLLMFGYFGAKHALPAMKDIVVGANKYYVEHEGAVHDPKEIVLRSLEFFDIYNPISSVMVLALMGVATDDVRRNRPGSRGFLGVALCVAGFLGVAMQAKFYLLHWVSVIAPATFVCALVGSRLADWVAERGRGAGWVPLAFAAAMGVLFALTGDSAEQWRTVTGAAWKYERGEISREDFTRNFNEPGCDFYYHDAEIVGLWLRDHSEPTDYVAVRGFEPEIYAVARRRYPGRFFWTTFLVNPARAYRRAEWLEEDRQALAAHPPRYVVTLTDVHEGLDSTEWFLPLGYVPKLTVNKLTILERGAPAPSAAR